MKIPIHIKVDLFSAHIVVFVGWKMKDSAKYLRKEMTGIPDHMPEYLETSAEKTLPRGVCLSHVGESANTVIWVRDSITKKNRAATISTIAHEAAHSAFRICKHCEIEIDETGQEILATLTGFIVEKILEKI